MIISRCATPEDVDLLAEFLEPFVEARQILPRNEEELATLVRHGFIAEEEGQIVGFAAVEIYSRKLAEIQCLAVAPSSQRRGLGTELVSLCVQRAKEVGVREVMAITSSENLFKGCGFDYALPDQKRALFYQTRD